MAGRVELKQLAAQTPDKVLTTDSSGNIVAVEDFPISATIGPAEDGDYTDGLFTDFLTTTPIGTAVDRFNEVLKSLVPPPAPDLSDWSGSVAGSPSDGKLSFDDSNPIAEDTYFGMDSGPSPSPSPVFVDGDLTISGKVLGIVAENDGDISGVLNDQVPVHTSTPTPAYPADAFGDAEKGRLIMEINGVEVIAAEVDLTSTTAAIDTTSGGTQSGMSVSAQDSSKFPGGDDFDDFQNRTGTWLVADDDTNLRLGYNYVIVTHEVVPVTDERILARFEWIIDGNTTATSFSSPVLDTLSMSGVKRISGIEYHTGGTAEYDVTINNAYRNTYSNDADAISFIGTNCSAPAEALGPNSGNELLTVNVVDKAVTIDSGIRIINDSIDIQAQVKRTVQATNSGGLDNIDNILMDDSTSTSTEDGFEDFADETYRLLDNIDYDLTTDVAANPWDPDQSLVDGSAGHTDSLQQIGGQLVYPGVNPSYPDDFRTSNIVNGPTFNDGGTGGSARDYTSISGDRVYIRYFRQVSPTTANFIMNIAGSGGTFRAVGDTTGADWIHVEIKGPSETGWMDAYADFVTGQFGDGDGARNATDGVGRAFATNWGITIGVKNTANTDGYMVIRITVPDTFAGELDSITWTFN